jgi:hypothetical protein
MRDLRSTFTCDKQADWCPASAGGGWEYNAFLGDFPWDLAMQTKARNSLRREERATR